MDNPYGEFYSQGPFVKVTDKTRQEENEKKKEKQRQWKKAQREGSSCKERRKKQKMEHSPIAMRGSRERAVWGEN